MHKCLHSNPTPHARPGAVYTPIQVDTRPAEQMQGWYSKSPLGRPGQPSEVALSFVFLASPEASLYCKLGFYLMHNELV